MLTFIYDAGTIKSTGIILRIIDTFSHNIMKLVEIKNGFTLIELMLAVLVFAILTSIAAPTYLRYMNEAKATQVLFYIHRISMAYSNSFSTNDIQISEVSDYSSTIFGQAPIVFNHLNDIYKGPEGLLMSSQLTNHSSYFGHVSDSPFPVLFISAPNNAALNILNALDHITKHKHMFVKPDVMMIALFDNDSNTEDVSSTQTNSASEKGNVNINSESHHADNIVNHEGGDVNKDSEPQTHLPGTITDTQANSGTSSSTEGPPQEQGTSSTPDVSSYHQAANTITWPPGWAKHPNQHHGHN